MSRYSFLWALLASVVLHGLLLLAQNLWQGMHSAVVEKPAIMATPALRLEAQLQSPHDPVAQGAPPEPLLKNTLESVADTLPATPPPVVATTAIHPQPKPESRKHVLQTAQRKLAQHMYYPSEAIALGLEGEVRLWLRLAEDGRVLEVRVAASSGSPVLDRAALDAAHAMGRIADAGVKELLLPVVFRLQ